MDELADVGLNSLRACRSLLVQAVAHDLKAAAWPDSQHVARWRHDAENFRLDARKVFAPSMRQRCPATLEELLGLIKRCWRGP